MPRELDVRNVQKRFERLQPLKGDAVDADAQGARVNATVACPRPPAMPTQSIAARGRCVTLHPTRVHVFVQAMLSKGAT